MKKRITLRESFVFLGVAVLILILHALFYASLISDHYTVADYVTEVRYYEDWNEYIRKICSRQTSKGVTTFYDCSYVQYHPPEYVARLSLYGDTYISKKTYDEILRNFNPDRKVFTDLHRKYHSDDGDMYSCRYDPNCCITTTYLKTFTFTNPVKATDNAAYTFPEVPEKEQAELKKVYSYEGLPEHWDPVDGTFKNAAEISQQLRVFNAIDAAYRENVYVRLLVYRNKPITIVQAQRNFWKNGKENELILCVNINDQQEVTWMTGFCWSPDGYTGNESIIREWSDKVIKDKTLTRDNMAFGLSLITKKWRKKNFNELDFLAVVIPWQFIVALHVLSVIGTIVSFLVVYHNEEVDHAFRYSWHIARKRST